MSDILLKLSELHQQATVERSHYYVGRVVTEAAAEIKRLRETLQIAYGHMMSAPLRGQAGRGMGEVSECKCDKSNSDGWGCLWVIIALWLLVGSCSVMDSYVKKIDAETTLIKQQIEKSKP